MDSSESNLSNLLLRQPTSRIQGDVEPTRGHPDQVACYRSCPRKQQFCSRPSSAAWVRHLLRPARHRVMPPLPASATLATPPLRHSPRIVHSVPSSRKSHCGLFMQGCRNVRRAQRDAPYRFTELFGALGETRPAVLLRFSTVGRVRPGAPRSVRRHNEQSKRCLAWQGQ